MDKLVVGQCGGCSRIAIFNDTEAGFMITCPGCSQKKVFTYDPDDNTGKVLYRKYLLNEEKDKVERKKTSPLRSLLNLFRW